MRKVTVCNIEKFRRFLIEEEKAQATVEKYIRDVTSFMLWCGDRELDKMLVLEYKKSIIENHSPKSVNSVISSLNSFFVFNGWFDLKLKAVKIQRQIFAKKEKELSKAEYERLIAAAKKKSSKRLYHVMQTICSTGIRVSELRFITVEAVKAGKSVINSKGKMRVVILPKQLCKVLSRYANDMQIEKGPVFVTKSGKPIDRSNIWSDMKKLCDEAGVPKEKVFPHNLRHLFARTYYTMEKDIVRLADILGHSSVNTTRIYTMETGEVHRRQIEKLCLLKC